MANGCYTLLHLGVLQRMFCAYNNFTAQAVQQRNKASIMQKATSTQRAQQNLTALLQKDAMQRSTNVLANSIKRAIISALHDAKDLHCVQQLTAQAVATKQSKAIKFRILQLQRVQHSNELVLLQAQFKKWERAHAYTRKHNINLCSIVVEV